MRSDSYGARALRWGVWAEQGSGVYAYVGDRHPLTPRFSGNLSLNQRFPLADRMIGFVGGALSYVGDRKGVFPFSPERQDLPACAKTDLRAGLDYYDWRGNIYVNNVFNRRGLVSGGLGGDLPYSFYYIQPRTVGISLVREF